MTVAVVVSNVIYPVGAVLLAAVLVLVLALRHRRPKSVEANMASFNRGLRALAPDSRQMARRRGVTGPAMPEPPVPLRARNPAPRGSVTRRRGTEAETG